MTTGSTEAQRTTGNTRGALVLAAIVIGGLAVVGVLGVLGTPSPGVLDQDTAFLVLGGALLVLAPATIAMIFVVRDTRRDLEAHRDHARAEIVNLRKADRTRDPLFQEPLQVELAGGSARLEGQNGEDMEDLRWAMDRQEEMFKRLMDEREQVHATREIEIERSLDRQERMIENVIEQRMNGQGSTDDQLMQVLERQGSMFLSLLEKQETHLSEIVDHLANGLHIGNGQGEHAEPPSRGAILRERPRYPVATYKVQKIPSLKASDARRLRAFGVNLTDTLLHTNLDNLADATGLDRNELEHWRATAELMSLDGLGPELSARLVQQGIGGLEELSKMTPDELTDTLMESYSHKAPEDREILDRTLPGRSERIIDKARSAVTRLEAGHLAH